MLFRSNSLQILEQLVRIRKEFAPSLILCPSSTDTHQDHRVVYEECERLFRSETMLGYIHPLNMREIRPDLFVPLTRQEFETKMRAWDCYTTQIMKDGPFCAPWLRNLSHLWEGMARLDGEKCEAFEFIRGVLA